MSKPVVAIVGRPNVGKSTLFNRLLGYRKAIVDDYPGVTRDRNYAPIHWRDGEFLLIDTGGFEPAVKEGVAALVRGQVQVAIEEADLILFMVNIRDGLNPLDADIGRTLRKVADKPIFLVLNQADSPRQEMELGEFLGLGIANYFLISAEQGRGLGELLDAIYDALPSPTREEPGEKVCTIAIVGRPNVGKSSLLNRLLGEERAIVSNEPGTTRDAVDTPFRYHDRNYLLIDTAGIRRSSKVLSRYERFSLIRAVRALERAEIALILLEATSAISVQDSKIASLADEKGCSSLLLINKSDLMPSGTLAEKEFALEIREKLKYLDYAPLLFISALTGKNVEKILPEVENLSREREKVVPTPLLNRILQDALEAHQSPTFRGQRIKIYYGTQVGVTPPTFILFTNNPEGITTSYRRYLSHKFREAFVFVGTPIHLIFRKR